ncbi:MAG: EAL domain-containing protein [Pseudomonadota bacterium]
MKATKGDMLLATALMGREKDDIVQDALDFVRDHLDMEIGYLSEFQGDELVFRRVSAPGLEDMISVGDTTPLDQVYCPLILSGDLPELIPDTAHEPLTQDIPLTHTLPIRAHVTVPIHRRDGTPYGMFCCLSRSPRPSLNARDLEVMRAFAKLSSDTINETLAHQAETEGIRDRILETIEKTQFNIAYQPIMDSANRRPKGFEALCRFTAEPYRTPDKWYAEAESVGIQADLEISAIVSALEGLKVLPPETYISVNASPATILTGRMAEVLREQPAERIVLELTEHAAVACYDTLLKELDILRLMGVRIAIDDAGAGYSGLQHIVLLRPDLIKLDISLTTKVDQDVVRRSLAAALVEFARKTGACIVAEGVETEAEFDALQDLGVDLMQGYLLGRPEDIARAQSWFTEADTRDVG